MMIKIPVERSRRVKPVINGIPPRQLLPPPEHTFFLRGVRDIDRQYPLSSASSLGSRNGVLPCHEISIVVASRLKIF